MSEEVQLEFRDGVAVITVDRPAVRNAIGLHTMEQLEHATMEIPALGATVVVITGGGDRAFISGGDLRELGAIRTSAAAERMAWRMRSVLDRLATLPMPVIAALNGDALGGGAEVAVAADLRIAADDIRIGFTQASLGIMPAWGGAERLTKMVGRGAAMLLLCTARPVPAQRAAEIGLIDMVLPREDFGAGWRDIAQRVASLPASVTRSIKGVVSAVSPGAFPETEASSIRAFAQLWNSPQHWEMAAAATAKRQRSTGHESQGQDAGRPV
jgi:enoyl-CoA hydratase